LINQALKRWVSLRLLPVPVLIDWERVEVFQYLSYIAEHDDKGVDPVKQTKARSGQ
jgi:hypothetical protein